MSKNYMAEVAKIFGVEQRKGYFYLYKKGHIW